MAAEPHFAMQNMFSFPSLTFQAVKQRTDLAATPDLYFTTLDYN